MSLTMEIINTCKIIFRKTIKLFVGKSSIDWMSAEIPISIEHGLWNRLSAGTPV